MPRLAALLAFGGLSLSTRANAIGLGVDVGAGAWVLEGIQADVHVRVEHEFFDMLKVGVRPGLAYLHYEPTPRLAIPLDAFVKLKLAILYIEALGGMFWIPSHVDPVRAHVAGGLGVQIWKFSIGVEVGYLQPSINILGRVGFTFF